MRIHKITIWGVLAAGFVLLSLSPAMAEESPKGFFSEKEPAKPAPRTEQKQPVPALKAKTAPEEKAPAEYVPPPKENIADAFNDGPSSSNETEDEPEITVPTEASITMDLALKDQVKRLREARQRQMPYLSKDAIREKININKLQSRQQFTAQGSKSLDDLLERAVQVHTPALASRERIALAKRRILGAVRSLAPEAGFEYGLKKGTLSGDPYTSQNYKITLSQPIFRGGVLWNTLLQEKAGLESAQKEYISVIEDLINEVTTAYLEYNRASQVVQQQKKTLKILRHYVDISKQKYSAQIISEIENLNVESLYSLNQYDHETSKQELELAKLDLQRYLDIDLDAPVETKPIYSLDDFVKPAADKKDGGYDIDKGNPSSDLAELVDLAYQHRSRLQVESSKLDSARLQEKIRLGEFMPKLDMSIDFGKLGESFKVIRQDPGLREEFRLLLEMTWNIGGSTAAWTYENDEKAPTVSAFQGGAGTLTRRNSFSIGLLDGLTDWVSIKEAEVAKLDQIAQLEKTEKEVIRDVKQAYFDYQKAKIRVKSSIQRYNYRKRLSAYSKHRLGKNEIQVSEYLQAEIDVLTETTTLHKALADYYTAKAKLNHSVGIRNYFPLKEFHADAARS